MSDFASRYKELRSPDFERELQLILDVTNNTFRQWIAGKSTPTTEKLVKLSEYFGVSTDYLLGISDVKTVSANVQSAIKTTGLSQRAIEALQIGHDREVVNLLLTNRMGKAALELLTEYFFNDNIVSGCEAVLLPDLIYQSVLTLAEVEFRKLRTERTMFKETENAIKVEEKNKGRRLRKDEITEISYEISKRYKY
jgi:transcriptional regulator with XRE-family HTH domain